MSIKSALEKHKRASAGRADLLDFLHGHGPENLDAIAELVGYERRKKQEEREEEVIHPDIEPSSPPPTQTVERRFPEQREKVAFWYVSQFRAKKKEEVRTNEPDWARQGEAFKDGEVHAVYDMSPPPTQPLVPWHQLWPFLKSAFGIRHEGRAIDLPEVINLVAHLKPVQRLPKIKRHGWAAICCLLLDFDERLTPFWDDLNEVQRRIEKLRGSFGFDVYLLDHGPDGPFRKREKESESKVSFRFPEPEVPVLILSDLGCLESSEKVINAWLRFGRGLKNRGISPVVLTPCPSRNWDERLLVYFRMVLWDRGCRLPLDCLSQPGFYKFPSPACDENAERLLRLLSPAIRVEPSLLREVRLSLGHKEADAGTEAAVWNHRNVQRCPIAFFYNKEFLEKYRLAFFREKEEVKRQVISLIERHHLHLAEPVRVEEKWIACDLLGESAPSWVIDFMEKYFRTIENKNEFSDQENLKAWCARFTERQHRGVWDNSIVWKDNRVLTAAWFKINYEDWKKGRVDFQPGQSIDDVAWLITPHQRIINYSIFQVGNEFIITDRVSQPGGGLGNAFDAGFDQGKTSPFTIGSPLATLTTGRLYLQAMYIKDNEVISYALKLAPDETVRIPATPEGSLVLNTDHEEITIESQEIPHWASGMGRDQDGLFASIARGGADAMGNADSRGESDARREANERRVYWFTPGKRREVSVKGEKANAPDSEDILISAARLLDACFWWDEAEYRDFLANGLVKPEWADNFGFDKYGVYADFTIKGLIERVTQRLRWIKPGRFMMGSPETEPERRDNETLHEVALTRGFWLAETACTQELWEAVMGKNPSNFKGKRRPVEAVSWNDCMTFLEKINSLMPGLDLRLPSEAEWEYACRAGTKTPFSFGDTITPDQVNYDGNYPYNKGSKGKYRHETVDVQSLPCNNWGLYEMHGNVWEWCSDWYGEYSSGSVIDPVGSDGGTYRVLRGGGWGDDAGDVRSADRDRDVPDYRNYYVGFRFARGHKAKKEQRR